MNTSEEAELRNKSASNLPGEKGVSKEHSEPQDVAPEDVNKPVSMVSICHEKFNLISRDFTPQVRRHVVSPDLVSVIS